MARSQSLFLYEEIMLLAIRDEKGTFATGFIEQVVAGAILSELLLDGRISIEASRKQLVDVLNKSSSGDPVIDECLEKMSSAKRRASLKTWVQRLAGIKNLKHKVASQLCERKILRADEGKVLLIFNRRIYPEINPVPEKKIINRMREAIFAEHHELDARTVVLVSLADGSDLLNQTFGRKELKPRKDRIKKITSGDLTAQATREVIEACQTALIVAAVMPAMISTTVHS